MFTYWFIIILYFYNVKHFKLPLLLKCTVRINLTCVKISLYSRSSTLLRKGPYSQHQKKHHKRRRKILYWGSYLPVVGVSLPTSQHNHFWTNIMVILRSGKFPAVFRYLHHTLDYSRNDLDTKYQNSQRKSRNDAEHVGGLKESKMLQVVYRKNIQSEKWYHAHKNN